MCDAQKDAMGHEPMYFSDTYLDSFYDLPADANAMLRKDYKIDAYDIYFHRKPWPTGAKEAVEKLKNKK